MVSLFFHEPDEAKYTIKKVTAMVILLMIASFSIAGCTSPTPTSTPTPTPTKIATSIRFDNVPKVSKSFPTLGINVLAASGILICGHGTVTVLGPDGRSIGTVSSGGSSDCYSTAFLDASSVRAGTFNVTLRYSGDSTYQPSESAAQVTVMP
ncbi:MAG: Ig-like domain-containing protein [Halobacteriota archaeon]